MLNSQRLTRLSTFFQWNKPTPADWLVISDGTLIHADDAVTIVSLADRDDWMNDFTYEAGRVLEIDAFSGKALVEYAAPIGGGIMSQWWYEGARLIAARGN